MAIGVSITKSAPGRGGSRERFSNVYCFETPQDDEATARDIIEALVPIEVPMHATNINFVEARAWSTGGTPAENETILILDLSGTGDQVPRADWFRTACFFVQLRTDRLSATGKVVYLSKYLRSHTFFNEPLTAEQRAGIDPLPGSVQDNIFNYMNSLNPLSTSSGDYPLCAPSGRTATSQVPLVDQFVEDHELKY